MPTAALTVRPAQGDGESRFVLVNLPDQPHRGEIIELPDGQQVTVDAVEASRRADVDLEVLATRYS